MPSTTHEFSLDINLSRERGKEFSITEIMGETIMSTVFDLDLEDPPQSLTFEPYTTVLEELGFNVNIPSTLEADKIYRVLTTNPGRIVEKVDSNGVLTIYTLANSQN